jgi:hypothetical protein
VCLLGALLGGSPAGAASSAAPLDTTLPATVEPGSIAPLESDALLFASPTTRDHVGRVVVPVMVNGQGPFRFIVDTGANHSTISPRLARELGLKPSEAASIVLDGITGTAQVSFVKMDRLQAGDLTIGSTDLPVVWAPVMAGADGILGAAGLTEKSLLINDVAIVFGEFHIFNVWRMQDQPAMILGMDVLGTVASLSIDFKNQDVYVGSLPARNDMLSVMRGMNADSAQRM